MLCVISHVEIIVNNIGLFFFFIYKKMLFEHLLCVLYLNVYCNMYVILGIHVTSQEKEDVLFDTNVSEVRKEQP